MARHDDLKHKKWRLERYAPERAQGGAGEFLRARLGVAFDALRNVARRLRSCDEIGFAVAPVSSFSGF